jgi:hypothetical protein
MKTCVKSTGNCATMDVWALNWGLRRPVPQYGLFPQQEMRAAETAFNRLPKWVRNGKRQTDNMHFAELPGLPWPEIGAW